MKLTKSENKFGGYKKHKILNNSYLEEESKNGAMNFDKVSADRDDTLLSASPMHTREVMSKTTNKFGKVKSQNK